MKLTGATAHEAVAERASRSVGGSWRTLLLMAGIALAPIVASYAAYYFGGNDARTNHGALVPTVPAPALEGTRIDGAPFRLADLRGRWVLVVTAGGNCDSVCERKLYATRQARAMQGKDRGRIARVWLIGDDASPSPTVREDHPELVIARVRVDPVGIPFGVEGIYLIDPLGNVVLRYGDDPDIQGLNRDLDRLLKASRIG